MSDCVSIPIITPPIDPCPSRSPALDITCIVGSDPPSITTPNAPSDPTNDDFVQLLTGSFLEANCVAGILYERTRTFAVVNNNLTLIASPWIQTGCCDCGGSGPPTQCGLCTVIVDGTTYTLFTDKPCDICLTMAGVTWNPAGYCQNVGGCPVWFNRSFTLTPNFSSGVLHNMCLSAPSPGNVDEPGCYWWTPVSFACSPVLFIPENNIIVAKASLDPTKTQTQWDVWYLRCDANQVECALEAYWTANSAFGTVPASLTGGGYVCNGTEQPACLFPATISLASGACVAGPLTCSLNAVPTSGAAPLSTVLTATCSGGSPPYTWTINYGDGTANGFGTSSPVVWNHTYTGSAVYTATAIVTDSFGNTCQSDVTIDTTGGGGSPITRTGFGSSFVHAYDMWIWTPIVTIPANSLVVIGVEVEQGASTGVEVRLNGVAMNLDAKSGATVGGKEIYLVAVSLKVTSTTVNPTIYINGHNAGPNNQVLVQGLYVQGLTNFVVDKFTADGVGSGSSAPNSGATPTTTVSDEYIQGWIFTRNVAMSGSPGGGFNIGNNDLVTGADTLRDLYQVVNSTGSFAVSDSVNQVNWMAICVTYS